MPLVTVGVERVSLPAEPSITDVYGLVARHFGLDGAPCPLTCGGR